MRTLIDNLPDCIYAKDADARKIMANPADLKNLGCKTEAEAVGKSDFDLFPKEIAEAFFADDQSVLKDGKAVINREEKAVLKNGEIRWLLSSKIPWRDAVGKIIGLVGIGRDITDKKILEAEVLRAQRMESLGRLATGIAHDLNNTLAPVLISVELLRQKLQDGDSLHVLDAIEASARRAAETVKQVLSFSRETEGRRTSVNPTRLIDGIVHIVAQTLPKNICVEKQVAENLWPILGNPLNCTRRCSTSASTQVKPCPRAASWHSSGKFYNRRPVSSQCTAEPTRSRTSCWKFQTPAAASRRNCANGFSSRFSPPRNSAEKNVGMGLSTALSIVKSHHGLILVKSDVGKGSVFQIYLPAEPDAAAEKHAV